MMDEPRYMKGTRLLSAAETLQEAIALEAESATDEAEELYQYVLVIEPKNAVASINLGTIYFNRKDYKAAETLYRNATEASPNYPLAFFNLGNVLDELKRKPESEAAHRKALAITPDYADAHYNLAHLLDRMGRSQEALKHWRKYAGLDPQSNYGEQAKLRVKRILATHPLQIVYRRGA